MPPKPNADPSDTPGGYRIRQQRLATFQRGTAHECELSSAGDLTEARYGSSALRIAIRNTCDDDTAELHDLIDAVAVGD
jgi:hypothetical protein